MRARQKEDALVGRVGAETEEDAAGAFVVGRVVGSDGEAERRREGLAQPGDGLQLGVGVEAHELRLAAAVDGLDEGDLSTGEAGVLECRDG